MSLKLTKFQVDTILLMQKGWQMKIDTDVWLINGLSQYDIKVPTSTVAALVKNGLIIEAEKEGGCHHYLLTQNGSTFVRSRRTSSIFGSVL